MSKEPFQLMTKEGCIKEKYKKQINLRIADVVGQYTTAIKALYLNKNDFEELESRTEKGNLAQEYISLFENNIFSDRIVRNFLARQNSLELILKSIDMGIKNSVGKKEDFDVLKYSFIKAARKVRDDYQKHKEWEAYKKKKRKQIKELREYVAKRQTRILEQIKKQEEGYNPV